MLQHNGLPFGLFKRKENEAPVEVPAASTLSIQQAQDLLRNLESARVAELAGRLTEIKDSVGKSLVVVNNLASQMEQEKIKFEGIEHRFKSVAENSRKTIVSSLRRGASTELVLPQSANDAKKFKEKFESMMNRFSEVSGSHSRVITAFMKKHANKMNGEFDSLKKLLNESKTMISDFEKQRTPIIKCNSILNTASQKLLSVRSAEADIQNIETDIVRIENELNGLKGELDSLRASPPFELASAISQKVDESERNEALLHTQLADLFSHVSRAFTKYSYGLSKETESRLQIMTDEPWRMLYESEILPYSSLLIEIHQSIKSGKIQLKDSDKVLNYLETILKSLPEFQNRARELRAEADSLRRNDSGLVARAKELEERIVEHEEEQTKNKHNMEQQKRQIDEKHDQLSSLLKETGQILEELTGQKYSIQY